MSWANLDNISYETEKLLQKVYEDNEFCFQTRLSLDEFVTKNFVYAELEESLACKLATQLMEKLDTYVKKIPPNDPKMFTIRRTLKQTYDNLEVSILIPQL